MPFRQLAYGFDSSVKRLYGKLFGANDLHGYIRWPVVKKYVDLNAEKTLEVGVGRGANAFEIALLQKKKNINAKFHGIDHNAEVIAACNKVKDHFQYTNYEFSTDELDKFEPESFDQVLLLDVLEHVEPHNEFLNEVLSKLKKGGSFVISVPTPNYPKYFTREATYKHIGHVRDGYTHEDLIEMLTHENMEIDKYQYYTNFVSGCCCWIYYKFAMFKSEALKALLLPPLMLISKLDFLKFQPSSIVMRAVKK